VKILTQIKKVFEGFMFWKQTTSKKQQVAEEAEQDIDKARDSIKNL